MAGEQLDEAVIGEDGLDSGGSRIHPTLVRPCMHCELTSEEGPRASDTNWRRTRHPASVMPS
jgi:hypothetical protein